MSIFITFCVVLIIQAYFYLYLFGKFSFLKPEKNKYKTLPVSVIICAKNEEENLQKFLPQIIQQDYVKFEIVLVDDASSDKTLEIMQNFKTKLIGKNLSIQIISISKKDTKGKKAALSLGIQSSNYEHLLLTDADCIPVSRNWISEMTSSFTKEITIVLGYGAYRKIKKSFLNKIIRFETLLTAIQYFSYAKIGKPYMGVGRNIAYKKTEFIKANGFTKHSHIISGDDDLFVNQIATSKNTNICASKNSFTISEPTMLFKNWVKQKRRHITSSNHYNNIHKFFLGFFYLSQILFWILAFTLLIFKINPLLTISLILLRTVIWYVVISKTAVKLDEKDLIRFGPIYEISIIFIQLYIFIRNIIISPKQW